MAQYVDDVIDLEEGERLTRDHDWSDQISGGHTLASVVVVATDLVTGLSATSAVLPAYATANNVTTFTVRRPIGVEATPYSIDLTMTRSDGEIFKDHYLMPGTLPTVYGLIEGALRVLGVLGPDQIPDRKMQQQALQTMNEMIGSWSSDGLLLQAVLNVLHTLTASTGSYTIGNGEAIDTIYPREILEGILVQDSNGRDWPVTGISREEYSRVEMKTQLGRPSQLYYEPSFPTGTVKLWPVPDAAYQISLPVQREITRFDTLIAYLGMESDYEEALKYSLALRLGEPYGKSMSPQLILLSTQAINRLELKGLRKATVVIDSGMLVV